MAIQQEIPTGDTAWQVSLATTLAAELSSGKLELPAFPEVVIRIREALADENVAVQRVAKLVATEAALAARLLRLANSAALNPGGKPVTELKAAITRMGSNLVRSSAISFAMSQIQHAKEFEPISGQLRQLWESATRVAAVSHAIARRVPGCNADEAMLVGLLHSIGKTYILTRFASRRPAGDPPAALAGVMDGWHANIARSILENWKLPEEIADAVGRQDGIDSAHRPPAVDLAQVLATARLLADYLDEPVGIELIAADSAWLASLGLDGPACAELLRDSREQIVDLERALRG